MSGFSEPLAKHTTLRVGGPAQFWVEPRTEEAFAKLIRFCRRENLPLFVIGRGSNLLVRDGGIRGVVVHPSGGEFDQSRSFAARSHRRRRGEAEADRLRGKSRGARRL